eukprot:PhF_6_TR5542/c0_g1_i4/m.7888
MINQYRIHYEFRHTRGMHVVNTLLLAQEVTSSRVLANSAAGIFMYTSTRGAETTYAAIQTYTVSYVTFTFDSTNLVTLAPTVTPAGTAPPPTGALGTATTTTTTPAVPSTTTSPNTTTSAPTSNTTTLPTTTTPPHPNQQTQHQIRILLQHPLHLPPLRHHPSIHHPSVQHQHRPQPSRLVRTVVMLRQHHHLPHQHLPRHPHRRAPQHPPPPRPQ